MEAIGAEGGALNRLDRKGWSGVSIQELDSDWVRLSLNEPVPGACSECATSHIRASPPGDRPQLGDTVYLAGFDIAVSGHARWFVKRGTVVKPLIPATRNDNLLWFKTADAKPYPGLSGAPIVVLRQRDGEQRAIVVGMYRGSYRLENQSGQVHGFAHVGVFLTPDMLEADPAPAIPAEIAKSLD